MSSVNMLSLPQFSQQQHQQSTTLMNRAPALPSSDIGMTDAALVALLQNLVDQQQKVNGRNVLLNNNNNVDSANNNNLNTNDNVNNNLLNNLALFGNLTGSNTPLNGQPLMIPTTSSSTFALALQPAKQQTKALTIHNNLFNNNNNNSQQQLQELLLAGLLQNQKLQTPVQAAMLPYVNGNGIINVLGGKTDGSQLSSESVKKFMEMSKF